MPKDAWLCHEANRVLVRAAKETGIRLRQSYECLSKRALLKSSRYAHPLNGVGEAEAAEGPSGAGMRDIERKLAQAPAGRALIQTSREIIG